MASPANLLSNVTDIVATTIEDRRSSFKDSVSENNAILMKLKMKGRDVSTGGSILTEQIAITENGNVTAYTGYDVLPVGASQDHTSAQYNWRQYAASVAMSGLEDLQNSGPEAKINLLEARIENAENSLKNALSFGLYSSGGSKRIDGLGVMLPTGVDDATARVATGTYGGINRANYQNWRPLAHDYSTTARTADTIRGAMNSLYNGLCRGKDHPDLILCDGDFYELFEASLQNQERYTSHSKGMAGFKSYAYKAADVILDGGIGGNAPANTAFFLNTDYIAFRPHAKRDFVVNRDLTSINQDAKVQQILWAGNLTCSGQIFQGRLTAA